MPENQVMRHALDCPCPTCEFYRAEREEARTAARAATDLLERLLPQLRDRDFLAAFQWVQKAVRRWPWLHLRPEEDGGLLAAAPALIRRVGTWKVTEPDGVEPAAMEGSDGDPEQSQAESCG